MPLADFRVRHFRAFADSGRVVLGGVTPIVGRNDVGKSGLLHALRTFFDPPKKGGLDISELHAKNQNAVAEVEVAFHPDGLASQEVQIDAKNKIHLVSDYLVDGTGLLRLKLSLSAKSTESFGILIEDVDDDDLFPLALKSQDELLQLLSARGLPATKAGKETNQEKRNALREYARSQDIGIREEWVDASAVEKRLRESLPEFMMFSDTADYGIGQTAVQNEFKSIVDRALSSHPIAQQIESDIQATIQAEFDQVFERMARLTDSVTSLGADAKISWRKAVDGIALNWGDASGVSIPYELRGAGVRRLFMVAYFQYQAAASLHDPDGPKYIFAVEEPEVHLHPGAQRDLDDAFRELADLGHSVLFTTHSPVFASSAPLRDLAVVVRPGAEAEAKQLPEIDPQLIARELGVEASDRLVGKNYIILVEGPRDVEFYGNVLTCLHDAGLTSLDPESILFLQCGETGLRFSVTTCCMDEAGLKWAVIADSDRIAPNGPMGENSRNLQSSCPATCLRMSFLDRTAIENYLDPAVVTAVTGIDCLIPQYGRPTDMTGNELGKGKRKAIKMHGPTIAQQMGAVGLVAHSQDNAGSSEFVLIFEGIRQAFGL